MNQKQLDKVTNGTGFVAALDQSGGSTPKALRLYGIADSDYSGEDEMFDLIHRMRTRIMTSPAFDGDRVIAAILFEQTMDREVEGVPTAEYLWNTKNVVPFLKVDKGLADEEHGAQVMKPMPDLDGLLSRALELGIFGTKMRSVIKTADETGVNAVVDQQFEVGRQILAAGLMPIIEPEIDINSPSKAEAETLMRTAIGSNLDSLDEGQNVMLKITLPEVDDFYTSLIEHPRVARVVALSGGYSRQEANTRLSRNKNMIASFSRAFTEGLSAQQSDEEFNSTLDESIASIAAASAT